MLFRTSEIVRMQDSLEARIRSYILALSAKYDVSPALIVDGRRSHGKAGAVRCEAAHELHAIFGLSYQEIAEILGAPSRQTARSWVKRGSR